MECGTITRKLNSVFEELSDAFGPMYVQSDFKRKAARLASAKSERMQILAELYEMFDCCGIPYEMNQGNSYYQKLVENLTLPSFLDLEDKILRELYSRYTAYQTPEQYMERIVSRLEAPEDHRPGDTLRLRMLRRFIRKGNYLADMTEIKTGKNGKQTLVRKCGGQKEIEDYIARKIGKKPDMAQVLEHLDDGVFARLEETAAKARRTGEEKIAAAMDEFRAQCRAAWGLEVTAGQAALLMDSQKMKRVEADLRQDAGDAALRRFAKAWLAAGEQTDAGLLAEKLNAVAEAKKALRGKKGVAVGAAITARRQEALDKAEAALTGFARDTMGIELTREQTELLLSKRRWNAVTATLESGEAAQPLTEKWASLLDAVTDAMPEQTVELLTRWSGLWNDPAQQGQRKQLQKAMDAIRKARDYAHEIRQSATALDGPVGLLRLVDDLASGMFREGGVTRRNLYLFAMVYEMPFYTGAEGTIRRETDLEKNLFQDYYSNNLTRYLSASFREKRSETELDPSGMGINYKNFAEMCYLYYISQPNLTPVQKIEGSTRMIQRLRESQRGAARGVNAQLGTQVFRGRVVRTRGVKELFVEDLLQRSEAEFEQFLRENYDCNTQRGYSMGVMELETEQNTAFENYQEILENLKEQLRQSGVEPGQELEHCCYGLCFSDVGAWQKGSLDGEGEGQMESFRELLEEFNQRHGTDRKTGNESLAQRLGLDEAQVRDFMELLLGVNRLLGRTVSESVSFQSLAEERRERSGHVIRALSVPNARRMTRTSMVVAYYYYYNALREQNKREDMKSFRMFYEDFSEGLDLYLLDSGYLGMSSKSIFDVLVAFSAYAYYNIG